MLTGFQFRDFPESRQRKIKNRSIRGIVLSEHADEESRFDLFERINTGSLKANEAEVRRGALKGKFQELVISLAEDSEFTALAPATEKKRDVREREELVTRFFAYGDGLDDYNDRVSPFLFEYTKKMNRRFEESPEIASAYRERFVRTMQFVSKNFPWGFRRVARGTVTPRSRFEAIAIGSFWALEKRPSISEQSIRTEDWFDGEEFKKIIGADGANAINRLRGRIEFVRDRLLGD